MLFYLVLNFLTRMDQYIHIAFIAYDTLYGRSRSLDYPSLCSIIGMLLLVCYIKLGFYPVPAMASESQPSNTGERSPYDLSPLRS